MCREYRYYYILCGDIFKRGALRCPERLAKVLGFSKRLSGCEDFSKSVVKIRNRPCPACEKFIKVNGGRLPKKMRLRTAHSQGGLDQQGGRSTSEQQPPAPRPETSAGDQARPGGGDGDEDNRALDRHGERSTAKQQPSPSLPRTRAGAQARRDGGGGSKDNRSLDQHGQRSTTKQRPSPSSPRASAGAQARQGGDARSSTSAWPRASVRTEELVAAERGTAKAVSPVAAPQRPTVVAMNAPTRPKAEREAKSSSSPPLPQRPATSGGKAASSASPWKTTTTTTTEMITSCKTGGVRTSKAAPTTKTPAGPGSSRRRAPPTDLSAIVKQRNGKLSGWRPGVEAGSRDVPRLRLSSSSRSSLSTNWDAPFLSSGNGGGSCDESMPGVPVAPSHQPVGAASDTFFLPWTQDRRRRSSSSSSPEPQATDEPLVYEVEATLPADDDDDDDMPDFSRSLGRSDSLFLPARLTRDPLHIATDNQAIVTTATGFLPAELLLPVDPALATVGTGGSWPVTRPVVGDRGRLASVQQQGQGRRGGTDLQRRNASSSRRQVQQVQHHHHHHLVAEPRVPSDVGLQYARMAAGLQVAAAGAGPRSAAWHGSHDDDDDIYDA